MGQLIKITRTTTNISCPSYFFNIITDDFFDDNFSFFGIQQPPGRQFIHTILFDTAFFLFFFDFGSFFLLFFLEGFFNRGNSTVSISAL